MVGQGQFIEDFFPSQGSKPFAHRLSDRSYLISAWRQIYNLVKMGSAN